MKYLIIDDNESFADSLCEKLNGELIPLQSVFALIAENIYEKTKGDEDAVILINANIIGKESRQKHEGITLLKWIRLNGCNNHCILYSFQSINTIVKANPLNSILLSKGVSFIQIPFSDREIAAIASSEKAKRENLIPYFRAEIDLVKIRHTEANWFGMRRMTYWINEIFNAQIEISDDYKNDFDFAMLEYTSNLRTGNSHIEHEQVITQIKNQRISYLKEIKNQPPKVVYIDDMAQDGWGKILNYLIYDKLDVTHNHFKIIDKQQIDALSRDKIVDRINQHSPDLILIDLRLKGKVEQEVHDYTRLLAFEIIKQIRSQNSSWKRKILIFTASNNFLLFKQMLKKSTNAPNDIFIKEGVDLALSYEQSLSLFKEINELIYLYLKSKKVKSSRTSIPKIDDNTDTESYAIIKKTVEDIKGNVIRGSHPNNFRWLNGKQIIFDTNIFLPKDSKRNFKTEYLTIKNLFESYKHNVWLHSSVLFELNDIKDRENGFTKMKALTEVYIELIDSCGISIIDKHINYTAKEDLADNYIKQYLRDNVSKNNLVLLSYDNKPDGPVAVAKKLKEKGFWLRHMYYNQDLKGFVEPRKRS